MLHKNYLLPMLFVAAGATAVAAGVAWVLNPSLGLLATCFWGVMCVYFLEIYYRRFIALETTLDLELLKFLDALTTNPDEAVQPKRIRASPIGIELDLLQEQLLELRKHEKSEQDSGEPLRLQMAQEAIRTRALIEGQESERRRISQDLHDGVGQMLTAIKIHVAELVDHPEQLPEVKALIEQTREEIRHISNNLMPNVLMDFGLHSGLKLIAKNTTMHSGLPVRLRFEMPLDHRLASELEVTLYRIAQEAVNNALKYAKASLLEIQFFATERSYILRVLDNGIGVKAQPQKAKGGQGLQTMRQRAELMGGDLRVVSSLARGTRVTVRVPRALAVLKTDA